MNDDIITEMVPMMGVIMMAWLLQSTSAEPPPSDGEPVPPAPPEPGLANIYGRVSSNNAAVGDVLVELSAYSTFTNIRGDYAILGLSIGQYTITFSKEGYESSVVDVTLVEGNNLLNVNLTMLEIPPTQATLRGYVTDSSTSQTIPGVGVSIQQGFATQVTESDLTGYYSFTGLAIMSSIIEFSKAGYEVLTADITLSQGENQLSVQLVPIPTGEASFAYASAIRLIPITVGRYNYYRLEVDIQNVGDAPGTVHATFWDRLEAYGEWSSWGKYSGGWVYVDTLYLQPGGIGSEGEVGTVSCQVLKSGNYNRQYMVKSEAGVLLEPSEPQALQQLAVGIATADVTIGASQWRVRVARTSSELTTGLSGVSIMPASSGMLFDLGSERIVAVNAYEMLIPLSLVFISEDLEVVEVLPLLEPGDDYISSLPCRFFLEVNAGEAVDVEPGNTVVIEGYTPTTPSSIIELVVTVMILTLMMRMMVNTMKEIK